MRSPGARDGPNELQAAAGFAKITALAGRVPPEVGAGYWSLELSGKLEFLSGGIFADRSSPPRRRARAITPTHGVRCGSQSSGNGCRRGSRKRDRCPGGHEAHENRPPYLALHLCRKY